MNIDGTPFRTIWPVPGGGSFEIIDQTRLPHAFAVARIETFDQAAAAIRDMRVRGAPLIGATAAYGLCVALDENASDAALDAACEALLATRPTAVNLRWAVARMRDELRAVPAGGTSRDGVARRRPPL